jgi:hypothetical protein
MLHSLALAPVVKISRANLRNEFSALKIAKFFSRQFLLLQIIMNLKEQRLTMKCATIH